MSYTNINLVRNHFALDMLESAVAGQIELKVSGTDWINLPGRSIKSGSLFVGAIRKNEPSSEKIILGSSPVSLSVKNIAADSVTVASDKSLGTIYTETIDYTLNPDSGEITRISDGSISPDSEVTVWYFYYEPYTVGEDYSSDYQWGRIKRLTGGNIADGQMILVKYKLSSANYEDGLLESVVAEANAIVQSKIDPEGRFGADPVLQAAASYLAVSLACRSTAVICVGTGMNQKQVSSDWLRFADSYRNDYEALLKSFRPNVTNLKPPVRT